MGLLFQLKGGNQMYTVIIDYNEENYERLTVYNESNAKVYQYLEGEVFDELKTLLLILSGRSYTVVDKRMEEDED